MKFNSIIGDLLLQEAVSNAVFDKLYKLWSPDKPNITREEIDGLVDFYSKYKNQFTEETPQIFAFLRRFPNFDLNAAKDITKFNYDQIIFLTQKFENSTEKQKKDDWFLGENGVRSTKTDKRKVQLSYDLWHDEGSAIINEGGLRVYAPKDQTESVKFGYWYHTQYVDLKYGEGSDVSVRNIQPWCVTWRAEDMKKNNLWGHYRSNNRRTFYYVIDDNKDIKDKYRISALQRVSEYECNELYRLTSLLNDGDNCTDWEDIVKIYPGLRQHKDLIAVKSYDMGLEINLPTDGLPELNEIPGSPNEFAIQPRAIQVEWLNDGITPIKTRDSWMSMDDEQRDIYITASEPNWFTVRFSTMELLDAIRKGTGNKWTLLVNTLKDKESSIEKIVGNALDGSYKVERRSVDKPNLVLYTDGSYFGIYNLHAYEWVKSPNYRELDYDYYEDKDGESYIVQKFGNGSDTFYSVYKTEFENTPDGTFMSEKSYMRLSQLLHKEGDEVVDDEPTDTYPSSHADIEEMKKGV